MPCPRRAARRHDREHHFRIGGDPQALRTGLLRVYCATKAGVRVFTRALRYQCQDVAPHVRVIDGVLPIVDTDMTRGRGRHKISAADAAAAVITGIRRGSTEIYVGKARLLPAVMRLSPALGYRILRNG